MDMASSRDSEARARPVGRPRADGSTRSGDVREEVLAVAAELFIDQGYSATTTRQISGAVGLRQGSFNHYFTRKLDILRELLDQTLGPALSALDDLDPSISAEHRLWVLLSTDCANLVSGEQNLASLMLLPEARNDEFADFWAARDRLKDIYRSAITAGIASGVLVPIDVELGLAATFGLVESLAMWFDPKSDLTADDASLHVARAALAGLLLNPGSVDEIINSPTTNPISDT
jgi:AcrR family transcriptional regulator